MPGRFAVVLLLAAAVLPAPAAAPAAGITLIGVGTLPGDTADKSGLPGTQTDGTPHNRLGGLGSAVAYTGKGNNYLLASDRGPKDGATDFACRVHAMTIAVRPGAAVPVALTLTNTTLLADEAGTRFVGTAAALNPAGPRRLDPEGIRVGRGGHFFLSDEYGPAVAEFDAAGRRVKAFAVPERFAPTRPAAKPEDELPPKNRRGRQPNRGFEGLAVSPDGTKLYAATQGPLLQDGALDAELKRVGLNCRILEIDRATGATREFVHQLHDAGNGVNEILAVNGHRFLVLERDSKPGVEAKFKRVYLIDLSGATDVSRVDALPSGALPAGVAPARAVKFLDLLDPRFGLAGPDFPEKIEGLAFGPDLPDGRRLLIVTADNDFVATVPFRVFAFGIDRGLLPGFVPQAFE